MSIRLPHPIRLKDRIDSFIRGDRHPEVPHEVSERGHHVIGTTRTRADELRALGAEPVIVDPLDATAVRDAVVAARPDVVVHQLTALSDLGMARNFDKAFAMTNRLRTEGTDYLIAAARAARNPRRGGQS